MPKIAAGRNVTASGTNVKVVWLKHYESPFGLALTKVRVDKLLFPQFV